MWRSANDRRGITHIGGLDYGRIVRHRTACADLLRDAGFRVFGTSRHLELLKNCNFEALELDVTSDASVAECVSRLHSAAGRIDVLVNNAGVMMDTAAIEEVSMAQACRLFQTNFFGVLRMIDAVLPLMRAQQGGRIINIGSVAGSVPMPYQGVYCASKHAVRGLSASLDNEVRRWGVHVCLVEPGFVRTHVAEHAVAAGHPMAIYDEEREQVLATHLSSMATGMPPQAVARVVLHAATARKPHLYYTAGFQAAWAETTMRFAPTTLTNYVLRRTLNMKN